jgi:protein-tyrosine phosphatase
MKSLPNQEQVQPTHQRGADSAVSGPLFRTSLTDPLRIDEVKTGCAGGRIGLTFCPGKCGDSLSGSDWKRDLELDLDVVAQWRADAVVTLIEAHEFPLLGVSSLGDQVRAHGIEWHHLPITDAAPPDSRFEQGWQTSGPRLRGLLLQGGRVLIHCRGGLGRAGTVAARLLVELGVQPGEAVARVRSARPGAIETPEQLSYVLNLSRLRENQTGEF